MMRPDKPTNRFRRLWIAVGLAAAGIAVSKPGLADSISRIEPPPPAREQSWDKVRGDQLTFAERLKEWGFSLEIEKKDELALERSPDKVQFTMSWSSPTKFEISAGVKTPENPYGESAIFKYKGEFSEEGTKSEASGKIEFPGGEKFSGAVNSGEKGLGYEFCFEVEKAFAALKGKLASSEPVPSYEVELDLTKLYNLSKGAMGETADAASVKLKLNPEKYAQRFAQFAPKAAAALKGPVQEAAGEAVDAVSFSFNPVLLYAATSNDLSLWIRQLSAEKKEMQIARNRLLSDHLATLRNELASWKSQADERRKTLVLIGAEERRLELQRQRGESTRALWREYSSGAAKVPAPPPVVSSWSSSGSTSNSGYRERDDGGYRSGGSGISGEGPTLRQLRGGNLGW